MDGFIAQAIASYPERLDSYCSRYLVVYPGSCFQRGWNKLAKQSSPELTSG
jgi:hypothetical protein